MESWEQTLKRWKKQKRSLTWAMENVATLMQKAIRLEDADSEGMVVCRTCGVSLHWSKANGCHYISRRHLNTKLDERNCLPGCPRCNKWMGGNHAAYTLYLKDAFGPQYIWDLLEDSKKEHTWTLEKLAKYAYELKQRIKRQQERLKP